MTKTLVMQGTEAGVDVHSHEGLQAWMQQLSGPFEESEPSGNREARRKAKKEQRKRQRKARRKNRR